MRLKTHISRAYWCDPGDGYKFDDAIIEFLDHGEHTCWLDHLLDGGLLLPGGLDPGNGPALTVLLSGSPGSGKSTLALEMCTRWSRKAEAKHPNPLLNNGGLRTLYVTTEAYAEWMKNKPEQMGWPGNNLVTVFDPTTVSQEMKTVRSGDGHVHILDVGDEKQFVSRLSAVSAGQPFNDGPAAETSTELEPAKITLTRVIGLLFRVAGLLSGEDDPTLPAGATGSKHSVPFMPYDVLVFDSVNTFADRESRDHMFEHFKQLVHMGPRLLIFVADSQSHGGAEDFWDFMSDVVIRLTRKVSEERYMVRTIEVTKARYQSHVWGVHQMKPYGANKKSPEKLDDGLLDKIADEQEHTKRNKDEYYRLAAERMREHPYRERGGVFIFPSIHFILSKLKKQAPVSHADMVESAVPGLGVLLGNGYPRQRCTALIGCRGGHKSHLAFLEMIARLVKGSGLDENKNPKFSDRALVITLRDDEGMTRETLQKILIERHYEPGNTSGGMCQDAAQLRERADDQLRLWERQGRLEISYFPPGYITPEEFFHRVLLSLNRLKRTSKKSDALPHVTVVVNSLDQLSSRFPLCAGQAIFIPGIIQVLSSEGASSFFVAAEEPGHPGLYGLDTMAELILDFKLDDLKRNEYLTAVREHFKSKPRADFDVLEARFAGHPKVNSVVVRVARYAGGQAAGSRGILELVPPVTGAAPADNHPLHKLTSDFNLICIPMPKL